MRRVIADSRTEAKLPDFVPALEAFYGDVVAGLSQRPRSLPCKYFYDERGSQLFEKICKLDEYYLTRTELSIMRQFADEMAEQIGPGVSFVEYGSGSSIKTRILLDHLRDPVAYVPVDISRKHLQQTADNLARLYPDIEVLPVCADFTEDFELPTPQRVSNHNAVYFPGSTIGNFQAEAAQALLARIVQLCGCGGGLLIGIDLQKDIKVIEAAYNDAQGITTEFNLNLLNRINRELNGDICLDQFEHKAHYNDADSRIEMYLVSRCDQTVRVGERTFDIAAGDAIRTEYSHKYTIDGFDELAAAVGLTLRQQWTDEDDLFAVLHFVVLD
jgi:dimethylhistidine N-methyltransferase